MIAIENFKVTISTPECTTIYPLSSICFIRVKTNNFTVHASNGESIDYPIVNQADRNNATQLANIIGDRDFENLPLPFPKNLPF